MDFGELRSALHATPSKEAWQRICEHFERLETEQAIEQALAYALPHLENHWDSTLRTLPMAWLHALLPGPHKFHWQNPHADVKPSPHPHVARFAPLVAILSKGDLQPGFHYGAWSKLLDAASFTSLKHLDLPSAYLDKSDLETITRVINHTPTLCHINLASTFLSYHSGQDAIRDFTKQLSPQPGQVRSLVLARNDIDSPSLIPLLKQIDLTGLTQLDLSHNKLGDVFIEYLVASSLGQRLKHLDISHNTFSPSALEALAARGVLPNLRTLSVRGVKLSLDAQARLEESGVQVLRQDPNLAIELHVTERGGYERAIRVDGPKGSIGRVRGNDLVLPKGNVSKRHVYFRRDGDEIIVEDSKSTGGTYLNGRKINGPTIMRPGDKLYVGDFIIQMRVPDPKTMHEEPWA